MSVTDLTGEIPVMHIARVPRPDVVQVRRPVVPAPVAASKHVALVVSQPRHSRVFYITRFVVRSGMWALFGVTTMVGISVIFWLTYAVWVTR